MRTLWIRKILREFVVSKVFSVNRQQSVVETYLLLNRKSLKGSTREALESVAETYLLLNRKSFKREFEGSPRERRGDTPTCRESGRIRINL